MKIKNKLFLIMTIMFTIFMALLWSYHQTLSEKMNVMWAERYVKKQITFDKYRTLSPIVHEISLVSQLAKEPTIIAMAQHEDNPEIHAQGIKTLERYRTIFQDKSYFCAFVKSGNYYFNDSSNQFAGQELRYVLSPDNLKDKWFYESIKIKNSFQINVNKDNILNISKVWINYVLYDKGEIIGIIGTGFNFDQFLKQSVGIEQEGIRNFFIRRDMSIQLAKDVNMIDYASITKKDGTHKTIDMLFKDPLDIQQINEAMESLQHDSTPNSVKTLWVTLDGKKHLLGIVYQADVGWFSLTLFDYHALTFIDNNNIFIFISILFMISLIVLGVTLKILVVSPIEKLKTLIAHIEYGHIDNKLPIIGSGEIAELSEKFNTMVREIQEHNQTLEKKIYDRTQALHENESKLNLILDNVDAYIYLKDTHCAYLYANKSLQALFGKSLDEIIGKQDSAFFDSNTAAELRDNDINVLTKGERITLEEITTDISGNLTRAYITTKLPLYREDGSIYALCGISTDITSRIQAEEEIRVLAFYDTLTNLPNRRLLADRLLQAQHMSNRNGSYGAILFMDLDNFKPLNDTYGHTIGDLLLVQVAQRIRSCIRESDTVARFGGDEFIVLLSVLDADEQESIKQASMIAEKIRYSLSHPYFLKLSSETIEEKIVEHNCTTSIGATLFLDHKLTQDEILQLADKAMYTAKENGRNQLYFNI